MTGPSPRGRGAVRSAVLRPSAHGAIPAQAGNRASTLPRTEASGRLSRTPIHRPDRDGELREAEGALLGPAGRWYWSAPVALDDASTTAEDDHAWAQLEGLGTRAHTGSATGGRQARPLTERGNPLDAKINCFGAGPRRSVPSRRCGLVRGAPRREVSVVPARQGRADPVVAAQGQHPPRRDDAAAAARGRNRRYPPYRPYAAGVLGTKPRRSRQSWQVKIPRTQFDTGLNLKRTHPDASGDRIPVSPRLTARGTIGEMTGGRLPAGLDGDRWAGRYAPTWAWVSIS